MLKARRCIKPSLALAAAAAFFCPSGDARAEASANADRPVTSAQPVPVRLGAVAGVGFPRPFAVEVLASFATLVDLGVEYGFLPAMDLDAVHTDLWSIAGDLRVRPFHGAFFLGVLAGRQHVGAATTLTASGFGAATEQVGLDSWFVNPRIGFLWTTDFGLALGMDAGVQVPVTSSVTSSLPLSLYPAAQARSNALGATWLPTLDLLRIGLML
jgi:hypothetical protein